MKDMVKIDQERLRAQLEKKLPPKVRLFQLNDIPGVMRSRMGWPVAAALMERWFRGAAFEMPELMKRGRDPFELSQLGSLRLDESAVTMNWALGFARVRAAMVKLQKEWATPSALLLLKKRINDQTAGASQPSRFGNLAQPAKVIDGTCQTNYVHCGQLSDPLDDFYGAMGEATLKIAVSGLVAKNSFGKTTVVIDELGFYLRDSYDFNDGETPFLSQPLGFWGFQGVSRVNVGRGIPISDQWVNQEASKIHGDVYFVQNEDFRRWRIQHGRGADFVVLSDVHRVRLPFPIKLDWQ